MGLIGIPGRGLEVIPLTPLLKEVKFVFLSLRNSKLQKNQKTKSKTEKRLSDRRIPKR